MNEWWMNLSLRERQTLSIGGFAVALFLIYALIWSPLSNKVDAMREQIVKEQKLLVWMKEADQRMQVLEKSSQNTKPNNPSGLSLLTIMQKQINNSEFVSSLTQLRQVENDSVQLSFTNVSFDKLIAWLTKLWKQENIVIAQMTVNAGSAAGVVSVDLVLKK